MGAVSPKTGSGSRSEGVQLPRALLCLALLTISFILNAIDRQIFSIFVVEVRAEYAFTFMQIGWLSTVFALGIGFAGIPTGYLLDRLSRKNVMLIGIAIYSVLTVLTAFATGFADMFGYRALTGMGEAMQTTALFAALGAFFPRHRALVFGVLNLAYGAGIYLSPRLGDLLATDTWRTPFIVFGLAGIVPILLVAIFVPKEFTERQEQVVSNEAYMQLGQAKEALFNRNVIIVAFAAMIVGMTVYAYLGLYPTFLQEELGFSRSDAARSVSWFGLGAFFSVPIGFIADRINQKSLMVGTFGAMGCVGIAIFNGPTSLLAQSSLSLAMGILASGVCFVNVSSLMQRAVRPHLVGRATGIFVTSLFVPASLAGIVFSSLIESVGWAFAAVLQLGFLSFIGSAGVLFIRSSELARPSRKIQPAEHASGDAPSRSI